MPHLSPPYPGAYIVFDGLDGSGKSTQCKYLQNACETLGYTVEFTFEPTQGPWGQKIREAFATRHLTPEQELDYLVRDRKEHVAQRIVPALEAGHIVIQDRYYFSTMAYQGSQGLDPIEIFELHQAFAPRPDFTFFLDITPEHAIQRIREGRGEQPNAFEQLDGLRQCKQIFDAIVMEGLHRLDGTQPVEVLQQQIQGIVLPWLQTHSPRS